jgi:hypothetical protein
MRSQPWINFKRQKHGLVTLLYSGWKSRALHGEARADDIDSVEPQIAALRDKISTYDLNDVYNWMKQEGSFLRCYLTVLISKKKSAKLHMVQSS